MFKKKTMKNNGKTKETFAKSNKISMSVYTDWSVLAIVERHCYSGEIEWHFRVKGGG